MSGLSVGKMLDISNMLCCILFSSVSEDRVHVWKKTSLLLFVFLLQVWNNNFKNSPQRLLLNLEDEPHIVDRNETHANAVGWKKTWLPQDKYDAVIKWIYLILFKQNTHIYLLYRGLFNKLRIAILVMVYYFYLINYSFTITHFVCVCRHYSDYVVSLQFGHQDGVWGVFVRIALYGMN